MKFEDSRLGLFQNQNRDLKFGEVIQPMMAEIAYRCTPRTSRHWDGVIAKNLIATPRRRAGSRFSRDSLLPAINLRTLNVSRRPYRSIAI